MAVVKGGLFSMRASGQVGKALVFSDWKGRPYVRTHVTPKNPKSVAQTDTRGVFTFLHEVYKQSSADFRAPWEELAKSFTMTSWNKFTSKNLSPLRGETTLANFVFQEGANGGVAPPSITVTAGANSVTVAGADPVLPLDWTLDYAVMAIIKDMDPHGDAQDPILTAQDAASPFTHTFTGLTTGALYRAGLWFKYTKADLKPAYSVSLQGSATPT